MQCSFVSIAQNGFGKWDIVLKSCSPIIPDAEVDYVTSKTNKMECNFADSKVAAVAAKRFAEEQKSDLFRTWQLWRFISFNP